MIPRVLQMYVNVGRLRADACSFNTQSHTMAKTAALSFRIEPALKKALEALAKADRRSLASYLEILLEQHVAERKAAVKK